MWRSNHSMNKIKMIYIQNLINRDIRQLNIEMSKTVKDLKKEIEKLFHLNYSLDNFPLGLKTHGRERLIKEEDENKTLFENHFTSECVVIFGKEKNTGGGRSYSKEINIKFIKNQNKKKYSI